MPTDHRIVRVVVVVVVLLLGGFISFQGVTLEVLFNRFLSVMFLEMLFNRCVRVPFIA